MKGVFGLKELKFVGYMTFLLCFLALAPKDA